MTVLAELDDLCDGWELDCKELCAIECNKRDDCDSFALKDEECTLLAGCDIGDASDGAHCGDDCEVYACVEGCPKGRSKPYFASLTPSRCKTDAEIKRRTITAKPTRAVTWCANKCRKNKFCSVFEVFPDSNECVLHESCGNSLEGGVVSTPDSLVYRGQPRTR